MLMIMNKVFGLKTDFTPVKDDASRLVVSYGYEEVDNENATWYEVYLYKKQFSQINIDTVKDAVIGNIDARTDEKILNGYQFTPDNEEEAITVWLSKESQTNFSEAQRLQIVPVKFKLNEDENKNAIYHTFETVEELNRFYIGGVQYINQCLNEGWQEKDSIDWKPYEDALAEIEEARIAAEEAARQAAEEEAARLAAEEAERLAKEQEEREKMGGGIHPREEGNNEAE